MSWVDETVAKFGRSIGLPALAFDANGRLDLEMQGGGGLGIRRPVDSAPEALLVTRSVPLGFHAASQLRGALRGADYRLSRTWPVRAAIEDEALVFAMTIPERAFTPDALEQAVSELQRLHAELGTGR